MSCSKKSEFWDKFGEGRILEKICCAKNHFRGMKELFDKQKLCDVVLVFNNLERIYAHRIVLAAFSEYFMELFEHNLLSNLLEIHISQIDITLMRKILDFCYTGEMEVRLDDMDRILFTANHFEFYTVTFAYNDTVQKHLNLSNCFDLALLAKQEKYLVLEELIVGYMVRNFMEIYTEPKFATITSEQMGSLLRNDKLTVTSDKYIYRAILSWVEHDPAERKLQLPHVMNVRRFHEIAKIAGANPHVPSTVEARAAFLLQTLKQLIVPTVRKRILMIMKSSSDKSQSKICEYCVHHGVCSATTLDIPARSHGIVSINNTLYMMLQKNYIFVDKLTFHAFDMESKSTKDLSNMLQTRSNYYLVVFQNQIYALGGLVDQNVLNSVEKYNIEEDRWTFEAPMLERRHTAGAAVLNDVLYVVGGIEGGKFKRSMESYCPKTNKWTMEKEMIIARADMGVVAGKDYLYVVGGLGDRNSVERYDPRTKQWEQMCSLVAISGTMMCTIADNYILAMTKIEGYAELYDIEQNMWRGISELRSDKCTILNAQCTLFDVVCNYCN